MGIRVITWDEGRTKQEVQKRFKNASEARIYHEEKWMRAERTIFATSSTLNLSYLQTSLESNFNIGLPGVDGSNAEMNAAYVFKNFRFIHAQMSANPPSIAMRPINSDQENHRKADAADRLSRWALRKYSLQERHDMQNLHTLLYGTGVMKTVWDSTLGDIIGSEEKEDGSLELQLEGDINISVPFMWNIYLDPDGKTWPEVKYVFEKIYMDYDEAMGRWPDKEDLLKKARITQKEYTNRGRESQLQNNHYNCVELLEYWETGLPSNGYLGRYCITTLVGDVVEAVRPNPFRFRRAGAVAELEGQDIPDDLKQMRIDKLPEQASLPYHFLTDVDIPNMVWGTSFIQYTSQLQETLNKIDSAVLDNIQAHGVARLVLPESATIDEEALSNSPWDVVKITGNQPPFFVGTPTLMPEMTSSRNNIIQGINDISGVNEAMFGQQSREQSGASMQYATNQGNMIRRRLFNKYVTNVESVYKAILNLVRKHWTVSRTIHVLGKERALEAIDIKGADIDGGYDVVGEYGVTLSLDPVTRREEILTLQPLFEKAGVPTRTITKMLKLNELEGIHDKLDLAESRQKEIFDEMVATGRYIPPKKYRDHTNMIAWAMDYFMTAEYSNLPQQAQLLCERHIDERAQIAATEQGAGQPAQAPNSPPGPVPAGVPAPGGPAGGPAQVPAQPPVANA